MCMWRPKANFRCHSSGAIHLVSWDRVSQWPGTSQFGQVGWPVRLRDPVHPSLPPQCWDYICVFLLFLALFTWVLKIKFRFPGLQVKYFTNKDISQPLCYLLNWILYYLKSTIIWHTWHDAVNRFKFIHLNVSFGEIGSGCLSEASENSAQGAAD